MYEIIKEFEGLRLSAYKCPANIPTIGYGTTFYPNSQRVRLGDCISEKEADEYLEDYIKSHILPNLSRIKTWDLMNSSQKEAVISFAYNLGHGFYRSSGFNSISKLLDAPSLWANKTEVHRIFGLYVKAGSRTLEGLVRRRKAEADLFLSIPNTTEVNLMAYPEYFLVFCLPYDRVYGLDQGILSLNHMGQTLTTRKTWEATSSIASKQNPEDFHQKGGLLPPHCRIPQLSDGTGGFKPWMLQTKPIPMPHVKGVEGNFYKINPHIVQTDKGKERGDFGIHLDANMPGSLGCIVMDKANFKDFEHRMSWVAKRCAEIPLLVF